ncbi:MAG TPA: hypothetical protein VG206_10505 [Terriglobia bacterium]|nr:hypothetical protein [Terriglobia bacterium]
MISAIYQELAAHGNMAANMKAVYEVLLQDFFDWLKSYAEKKALVGLCAGCG